MKIEIDPSRLKAAIPLGVIVLFFLVVPAAIPLGVAGVMTMVSLACGNACLNPSATRREDDAKGAFFIVSLFTGFGAVMFTLLALGVIS